MLTNKDLQIVESMIIKHSESLKKEFKNDLQFSTSTIIKEIHNLIEMFGNTFQNHEIRIRILEKRSPSKN